MSWSAYACRLVRDPYFGEEPQHMPVSLEKSDELILVFMEASRRVQEHGAGAEAFLENGSLHCRASARAITQATGEQPYCCEWSPDKVKDLAARANWHFSVPWDDLGCKMSAEAFLNVCAEHSLGIKFD